jgi:glycosyltransferase involved in cell wall biosynthesis
MKSRPAEEQSVRPLGNAKEESSPGDAPRSSDQARGRPLTVALISPGWPPATVSNGIATYVDYMRDGLAALGHRPLVFTSNLGVTAPPNDVIRINAPRRSLASRIIRSVTYRLQGQRAAARWQAESIREALLTQHARAPIDIVEIEETFGVARHLIGRLPFPVVVKMHGPACIHGPHFGEPVFAEQWRLTDERTAIEKADGVTSPSAALLSEARMSLGLSLGDAKVLHNPTATVEEHEAWRLERSETDRIVFIGRFDRHKGGDLLIDAFAELLMRRPSARLTMIGPDPGVLDDSGHRWRASEYIARRLPNPEHQLRVEYLGKQPHHQLNEWRRRAAVVVVPSRYDNFPNSVLEAAALGAPIVAADVGGIPEIVTHQSTGCLFPAGNVSELAAQLLWMLENPKLAAALGAKSRESCETHFSPARAASDTVTFYESVISRWSGK